MGSAFDLYGCHVTTQDNIHTEGIFVWCKLSVFHGHAGLCEKKNKLLNLPKL